ncbi:hypothetical protein [Halovulum sp. GXIMD14793]
MAKGKTQTVRMVNGKGAVANPLKKDVPKWEAAGWTREAQDKEKSE